MTSPDSAIPSCESEQEVFRSTNGTVELQAPQVTIVYSQKGLDALGIPIREALPLGREAIERILRRPFDETDLDAGNDDWFLKMIRTVHALSYDTQVTVPIPLAVKGPGLIENNDGTYRMIVRENQPLQEDLVAQFRFMNGLKDAFREEFTDEERAALDIITVFGAAEFALDNGHVSFLFMQQIEHAKSMEKEEEIGVITTAAGQHQAVNLGIHKSKLSGLMTAFPELDIISPGDHLNMQTFGTYLNGRLANEHLNLGKGFFSGRTLLEDANGKIWLIDLRNT